MQVGIDSYCYHRFFGEIYPGLEGDPGQRMTVAGFIARAGTLGVQGVSIESFMLSDDSPASLATLRAELDNAGLARVWAWGHPRGLESGTAPQALNDLKHHVDIAVALGASVMRICAGGRRTRTLTWAEHRGLLMPLLHQAADFAAARGVTLALENHIDLSTDEMLELIGTLNHPALGICLDTANNLRMFEDPAIAIERMAPYARAVHFKDIAAYKGSPRDFGFWPSVPIGSGLIDLPRAITALRAANYTGLLALEIDYLHPGHGDLDAAIERSIARMREMVALSS